MMLQDQWTIMNNSSLELNNKEPSKRKKCCRVLLWLAVVLVSVTTVAAVTLVLLHIHGLPLPFLSRSAASIRSSSDSGSDPALDSASQALVTVSRASDPDSDLDPAYRALVTVSRASDSQPVRIFLDPNCPDLSPALQRLDALHDSLLEVLLRRDGPGAGPDRIHPQQLQQQLRDLLRENSELKQEQHRTIRLLNQVQEDQNQVLQALAVGATGVSELKQQIRESVLGLKRETESLQRDTHTAVRPTDCSDLPASAPDGVYSVFPPHQPDGFRVYCDMSTDGGGWTVFQRRQDGSVNFYRGWDAYRDGFGTTTGEHWLGLHRIYSITSSGGFELRIDMSDFENGTAFALYSEFSVGRDCVNPEEDGYPLQVEGYSGTAGDSLLKHSGMRFTTKDRDQDQSENNCAAYYQGAWWYRNCHTSNLNGQYLQGGHASYADGVEWSSWTGWQYSLRFTEMKVRPRRAPRQQQQHQQQQQIHTEPQAGAAAER